MRVRMTDTWARRRSLSFRIEPLPHVGTLRRSLIIARNRGKVAEWFKAAVLKTAVRLCPHREFESHPFRSLWVGAGVDERSRLLSGCLAKTGPRVRIPVSPLCPSWGTAALRL